MSDQFEVARYSNRLVEQQRERIAALEAERDALRAELAALKAPAVAGDEREAFEARMVLEAGPSATELWIAGNSGSGYANERVNDYRFGWMAALEWVATRPAQTEQQPVAWADPSDLHRMETGSLNCINVYRAKKPCVYEPLFLRAAPIAQTPADGQTFMGEPLVQPYEAPRKQVDELFKLLGFKGQAEVGVILDAAISAIKAAQPAEADGVPTWRERILAIHPKSDPKFWRDALLVEHMQSEIEELRAALSAVTAERDALQRNLKFTEQWYAVRFERLADLGKSAGCWDAMAAIIANGTVDSYETPTYAQQLVRANHRADVAERERDQLRAEVDRYVPLHEAVQRAAGELPEGWAIQLYIELDGGGVELIGPGGTEDFATNNERLDYTVIDALEAAMAAKEG